MSRPDTISTLSRLFIPECIEPENQLNHLYSYVNASPINVTDPLGLFMGAQGKPRTGATDSLTGGVRLCIDCFPSNQEEQCDCICGTIALGGTEGQDDNSECQKNVIAV